MEGDELELFRGALDLAFERAGGGAALDVALLELGWIDAMAEDRRSAISLLFEGQGRSGLTSSALDWLLGDSLGIDEDSAVVLPALRRRQPPGEANGVVLGLGLTRLGASELSCVVIATDDGPVAMDVPTSQLELRLVDGIDPRLGLREVHGALDKEGGDRRPVDWDGAIALGQLALAHELVGAARSMLELARQHALDRVQFGRPIAMFQAVRHRLAESLIAIEAADSLLVGAWENPSPVTAAMAKGLAGRNARTVAKHCQQVLAGIGFTAEHPFHLLYKRVVVLDQLLGSASTLTRALGTEVVASGSLPATFPL